MHRSSLAALFAVVLLIYFQTSSSVQDHGFPGRNPKLLNPSDLSKQEKYSFEWPSADSSHRMDAGVVAAKPNQEPGTRLKKVFIAPDNQRAQKGSSVNDSGVENILLERPTAPGVSISRPLGNAASNVGRPSI